ncbi:hypothetical protein AB0C89_36455 [Streptomyces sp. NPDC048491]|uniref:hypothetical protein n=1 Tax=Streptomyces sp. NPDC048491 TaxID=3157207 RepID=UPI0034405154
MLAGQQPLAARRAGRIGDRVGGLLSGVLSGGRPLRGGELASEGSQLLLGLGLRAREKALDLVELGLVRLVAVVVAGGLEVELL